MFSSSKHSLQEKLFSTKLMKEAFGDADIAYTEYYDWQYLENPNGVGTVVFVFDNESPVGQVASIPTVFNIFGKSHNVTISMNVCVTKSHQRRGILTSLMKKIHELGPTVSFSLGIPNKDSMKGHLKNDYYPLEIPLLVRPIHFSKFFTNKFLSSIVGIFDPLWKINDDFSLDETEMFDESYDYFFLSNYCKQFIIQSRSQKYLNWRYIKNPRREYKIFQIKNNSKLCGYIILRVTEVLGNKVGFIMDFMIQNNILDGKKLVKKALSYFWQENVSLVMVGCFPGCNEYSVLKKAKFFDCPKKFRPHPLTIGLKFFGGESFDVNLLKKSKNWFFMLGDYETF